LLDDPAVDSLLTIFIMRLARIRCEDARPPALVRIATRRPDGSGWCASSPATSKSSSSVSVRITPAAWKSASTTLSEHASAPVWDDATRAPEAERPLLTAGTWSTRAYAVAVDFCGGRVHWHDLAVKAAEGQVVKDCCTDGTGLRLAPMTATVRGSKKARSVLVTVRTRQPACRAFRVRNPAIPSRRLRHPRPRADSCRRLEKFPAHARLDERAVRSAHEELRSGARARSNPELEVQQRSTTTLAPALPTKQYMRPDVRHDGALHGLHHGAPHDATDQGAGRMRSTVMSRSPAASMGFWSAVSCTVLSLLYVAGQLVEWLGWLGSAGGPSSRSTPMGIAVLLTPSLLLAPAFLLMMMAIHAITARDRQVYSHAAVAFATIYATLVSTVYFAQLTWVMPRLSAGRTQGLEPFIFEPFDSFLYTVDILGYSFMSIATLLAAPALRDTAGTGAARVFLLANAAVLPFLAFQMYWRELIWIASVWAVTFPAASWAMALVFRRGAAR
jgi:hypothetical protein